MAQIAPRRFTGGLEMRASKLLMQITVYYLVIAFVIFVALKLWPELRGYLPIGGVEQLISQPTKNPLQAGEAVRAAHVANFGQSVFWLVVAIIAAILVSLPVSWTYMAVRGGEEYDQSLVNTILVLPMVVTGIVIIVQNSPRARLLACRHCGGGAVQEFVEELGRRVVHPARGRDGLERRDRRDRARRACISICFNYTFAMLWITEYGERAGMKRYLADYDGDRRGRSRQCRTRRSKRPPSRSSASGAVR